MNLLLFFSLCWMLPAECTWIRLSSVFKHADKSFPMTMAKKSVDDMYEGCTEATNETVETFFSKEKNNEPFASVWEKAENCANDRLKLRDPEDQTLTKNHMQAICAYTSYYKAFHHTFNDAVRTKKSEYNSDFPYHYLHFWLTSAVQILNRNKECQITYRSNRVKFAGKKKKLMRFGNFASSSYKINLLMFGKKTCFKITTCLGAYLKKYSMYTDEEEVLIPPYEVFQIMDKIKINDKRHGVEELKDCEVVYVLESAGVRSDLNCKPVI